MLTTEDWYTDLANIYKKILERFKIRLNFGGQKLTSNIYSLNQLTLKILIFTDSPNPIFL
jgi:hypothetical protein